MRRLCKNDWKLGRNLRKRGLVQVSGDFELSEFELSGLVLHIINAMPSTMVVSLITRGSISRPNDTAVNQIKRTSWLVKYEWSSGSSSHKQVCKQSSEAS